MKKKNIMFSLIFFCLSFIAHAHAVEFLHRLELYDILQKQDKQPFEEGFCLGTLIKTFDGYKLIEDCVIGDVIIDSDGEPTSVTAITKKYVNKYIEFFLDDGDAFCIGYDQLLYSDDNDAWLKASDIVSGMVRNKKTILYALTTQSHTLCVTKHSICAHNAAALCLQMTSMSLGHIAIVNPVVALFGGISISLAVIAYEAYEQYLKQTNKEHYCDTNIPDTVVLAERFYYEQRKIDLERVIQELLSIKSDLTAINDLSSMHFSGRVIQKYSSSHDDDFWLLSVEQEKYLSDEQRYALRVAREKELEFLEQQIQNLQLLLALNSNQLINNINYLENMCVQLAPEINIAIDRWNNNTYAITDVIAIKTYENIAVQDFLINELCDAYSELIAVAKYYQGITSKCINYSTTIRQSLEEMLPATLAKQKVIAGAKNSHYRDAAMIEKYCVNRNIPIVFLRQEVKRKLRQQGDNYEAECLNDAETIISSGGFPDGPKKDDEDNKRDFFQRLKIRSNKKIFCKKYGKFYKDSKTNLWWAKDRSHHGGSIFKVFKERATGLEWIFDADELGDQIINKHKGPIGLFIPFKSFVICQ